MSNIENIDIDLHERNYYNNYFNNIQQSINENQQMELFSYNALCDNRNIDVPAMDNNNIPVNSNMIDDYHHSMFSCVNNQHNQHSYFETPYASQYQNQYYQNQDLTSPIEFPQINQFRFVVPGLEIIIIPTTHLPIINCTQNRIQHPNDPNGAINNIGNFGNFDNFDNFDNSDNFDNPNNGFDISKPQNWQHSQSKLF
ncbi:hypothetical protein C1645_877299 [Glomus cerebriforme]|uniref:Uncharacterized protein n=1 Tax=Glomus cerebriforme TaxID=658196 RepID=A0A397SQX2_9GLOM|nr:hypothetical protein C1645_877299 [Glomus cerebriforme]